MLKKKKKTFFISNAFFAKSKAITPASALKKGVKKLVLVLRTFLLVIIAQKKAAGNAGIGKIKENSENNKNEIKNKNLKINLI